MGCSEEVVRVLETLLPGWNFVAMDARGRSGGLASGWKVQSCRCDKSWGINSGVGLVVWDSVLGKALTILNIYGPYLNRASFWDTLFSLDVFEDNDVILGGDFNLSLGLSEVWGPRAAPDALANFFIQAFARNDLLDILPPKIVPTWRNKRAGDQRVAKRLDRFLVAESLALGVDLVQQWVGTGGISDHCPIFLELRGARRKPPSPFKFNSSWMKDEGFHSLVKKMWNHRSQTSLEHAGLHFYQNLKCIKEATIAWAHAKRVTDDKILRDCELAIDKLLHCPGMGFLNDQSKDDLLSLEKQRNVILCEREEMWRLKSRAIWLQCGDENTKFFQAYAKGRKFTNSIWELSSVEGEPVSSFDGLADMGVRYFGDLFSAPPGANIAEVLRVTQLFPHFVDEEENRMLMGEVSMEELSRVLHSFQKDKSPGPDGWTVDFFLGFFYFFGEEERIN